MKVTITKIYRGKQQTKFGQKDKIAIKTDQHGDKWVTGFDQKAITQNWNEGDIVDVTVKQNGEYLNLEFPKAGAVDNSKLEEILKLVKEIHRQIIGQTEGEGLPKHMLSDEEAPF